MPERDPGTEALHDAIAAHFPGIREAADGAVLVGWVVVAEWMDTGGRRWLADTRPPTTSRWAAHGMLLDTLTTHARQQPC